jgi:hypothetical protein
MTAAELSEPDKSRNRKLTDYRFRARLDFSAKNRSLPAAGRLRMTASRVRGLITGLADGLLVEFIWSTWALFRGGGGPRIGIEGWFYGR